MRHTIILVFCYPYMVSYDGALRAQIFLVTLMLVHVSSKNVPTETFNISL